jgi:hypothetical protein
MTKGEPTTDNVSAEVAEELLCEDVVYCMLDELELLPNKESMRAGRTPSSRPG